VNRIACLTILALSFGSAWADTPPVPGWTTDSLETDFVVGSSLAPGPGFPLWPGGRVEYDFLPSPWGLELGYAYRNKEYFSFNHQTKTWSGPWPWDETDTGGLSEADWPFYQTRHVLSPGVVFRTKPSWIQPKLSVGALFQFYVPAEAQDYYPGFQTGFQDYLKGVQTLVGNYLKLGFDWRPWPIVSFGTDFVFEIPNWGRFFSALQERPVAYARTNAHLEFRLGVRL